MALLSGGIFPEGEIAFWEAGRWRIVGERARMRLYGVCANVL